MREHVGNILNHTLYRNAFLDNTKSKYFDYIIMLTVAKFMICKNTVKHRTLISTHIVYVPNFTVVLSKLKIYTTTKKKTDRQRI